MTAQEMGRALPPGYKLHWYVIQSVLGQGGFGITYLAHDTNLDKAVAIKEYLPQQFARRLQDSRVEALSEDTRGQYQWGLDRFISEARTLSRFEHPNIVRVHAVFEENGTGYMVMSYEQGEGLQDILKRQGKLDEATLLGILRPLLEGLELVHRQNFIHRDIKPDNIYIRGDGSPVLLDFGSARQSIEDQPQAMTVMVTPGYAPFEQYSSDSNDQGPWTDIYGLGATSYKAITGRLLTNAVERSKTEMGGGPGPVAGELLKSTEDGYSEALLRAVNHAIAFDPKKRPQTVREWLAELPTPSQLADTVVDVPPAPPIKPRAQQAGSRRGIYLAVAAVLLVAAGAGAYFLQQGAARPAAAEPVPTQAALPADTPPAEPATPPQQSGDQTAAAPIEEESRAAPVAMVSPPAAEAPADDPQAEAERREQERLEAARLEQEREAAQRQEEERQERERLARQQLENERRALEAEKAALALEREKALAEQQRQAAINSRIQASEKDFVARRAAAPDTFEYDSNDNPQPLETFPANTVTLQAFANASRWQGTGLAIERGRSYRIKAGGSWKMGTLCNPTDATGKGMYALLCQNLGGQTVAGYDHGALIGKIGRGSLAFYIGPEFTFTAGDEGELFLMGNDAAPYIVDNSGSLSVTITSTGQ
ncbi:protein kinase [Parahaliea maris]|uniref:non-specific serine/threonine protein kinase n=1 Tax=Parahaliea maris TaxID=2716870 RepID=A0A5C9A039_9GAMM|nr:serine/threonine-protein kinase [Parahaliea maris]TXS94126.1 protein kinase [Parahaliea maris]